MNRIWLGVGVVAMGLVACAAPRVPGLGPGAGPNGIAAPGAVAALDGADELWIFERAEGYEDPSLPTASLAERARRAAPGSGGLFAESDDRLVLVPLTHTAVEGRVVGDVANVRVHQDFENPYDEPIDAHYVFPLPANAAVSDFLMRIGERTIRGVVREREEARALYDAARTQGIVASLVTQERPNVFVQRIANIAPRATIRVALEYFHTLPWRDDAWELAFPMVVGPRYEPRTRIPKVSVADRRERGADRPTERAYLRPDERSGHDLELLFDVESTPLTTLECTTHAIATEVVSPERTRVRLAAGATLPNRDFVLRLRPAAAGPRTTLATSIEDGQGFARLTLAPPNVAAELPPRALELVLIVDTSGSMSGETFELARDALVAALEKLEPEDTFRVVRFSADATTLATDPRPATPENLRAALRYVRALDVGGGTEMLRGLRSALRHHHDSERTRVVALLTDGFLDNEEDVLREVRQAAQRTRFFSFGIGSSPNRFLLEAIAREGRGAVAYVNLEDSPQRPMNQFLHRVRRPALTDVEIDWGGLRVDEVYPSTIGELYVGRPLQLLARFDPASLGDGPDVRIRGRVGGEPTELAPHVLPSHRAEHPVGRLWARAKIADLTSRARGADPRESAAYGETIRDVALEHGIVSVATAFLAIDTMTRVEGESRPVPVRVPVPEGTR